MSRAAYERSQELAQQNTSKLLRTPYQVFIGHLFDELAAAGYADIHPSHAIVFQHVPDEGLRVTELAERTQLTKQYVGRLVDELERLGYLTRTPEPTDRRAKLVRLAERGRAVTRDAERIIDDIEGEWAQRLGASPYADLRQRLIELILALHA